MTLRDTARVVERLGQFDLIIRWFDVVGKIKYLGTSVGRCCLTYHCIDTPIDAYIQISSTNT